MSAMRVKQLANELNMDPKELVKKLNEVGIAVKTHASPMSEDDVKLAREKLAKEVVEAGGKVDAATKKKVEAEIKKTKEKEKAEVEAKLSLKSVKLTSERQPVLECQKNQLQNLLTIRKKLKLQQKTSKRL